MLAWVLHSRCGQSVLELDSVACVAVEEALCQRRAQAPVVVLSTPDLLGTSGWSHADVS